MPYIVNKEKCISCQSCVNECPMSAISMDENGLAEIDANLCADCGSCEAACPNEAIDTL